MFDSCDTQTEPRQKSMLFPFHTRKRKGTSSSAQGVSPKIPGAAGRRLSSCPSHALRNEVILHQLGTLQKVENACPVPI